MTTIFLPKLINVSDKLNLMDEDISKIEYDSKIMSQLHNQVWYHGLIKRIEAEFLVKNDGDFLVRDSISKEGEYVLTVQWLSKPLHFQINQEFINNKMYYKFEDEQFPSIVDLINFFRTHKRKVTLLSGCIISNPITCQLIKNKLSNKNYHISEIEANYARLFNSSTPPRLPKVNRNLSQETMLCNAKKYLNKSESNLNSLFNTKEKFNNNNFKSTSNIKLNILFSIKPQETKLISSSFIKEKEGEQDYCDIDYDTMENFPLPVHIKRLSTNNEEENILSNLNKNYSNSVHDLQTNLGDSDNHHINNNIEKTRSFSNLRFLVNPTNARPVSLSSTSSSSTTTSISNGSYNLNTSKKHSKFITQPRSISRASMGKTAASLIAEKKRDLVPSLPQRPLEDTLIEDKINNESISELLKLEKELKQSIMSLNNLVMVNNDRDSACVLDTSNEGDYDCLPITNKSGSLSPDSALTNETDESESENSSQTSLSAINIFCDRLISMNVNSICRMITEEDIKLLNLHLENENEISKLLLPFGSIIRQECAERSSILSEIVINTLYCFNNTKLILEMWTRVASSLLHDYGNLFSFSSIYVSLKQFYEEHHYQIDSDDSSLKLIKSLLAPIFEDLKNTGEINYKNNTGTTMIPYIQPFIKIYNNDSLKNYESSLIISYDKTPIDKQLDYMWTWLSIGRKWCQNVHTFVNKAKLFYKPENEIKHNIFEISQLRTLLNKINQNKKKNEKCYTDNMYINNI